MSSYKVAYFPLSARAQVTRCILSLSGANWSDRVPNWPAEKSEMPFTQLPLLEETRPDGSEFKLAESSSIERYLSNKFGLLPSNEYERATCDMLAMQMKDVFDSYLAYAFGGKSQEALDNLTKKVNLLISKHEPILAASKSGHYFGDSITYPDLYLYTIYAQFCERGVPNLINSENAPHMIKLVKMIHSNPKIDPSSQHQAEVDFHL
ncbi:hypothetical protein BB559_002072 [Furculomyces boomerangus]|uniref:glutathione transferase n=2 Tax=Harpellales TaxID=61421 RepID=A0A2T9YYE4_9FUNG|nr:hypothetical protein BB559_002072 [Furculomyces boomerangus]PWA00463.1 hypothetical protein BB558_003503 [Smittium angustum]